MQLAYGGKHTPTLTLLVVERDTPPRPNCDHTVDDKKGGIQPLIHTVHCGKGYNLTFTLLVGERGTPSHLQCWLWKGMHSHVHHTAGGGKGYTITPTLTIHPQVHTVDWKWIHLHVHTLLVVERDGTPSADQKVQQNWRFGALLKNSGFRTLPKIRTLVLCSIAPALPLWSKLALWCFAQKLVLTHFAQNSHFGALLKNLGFYALLKNSRFGALLKNSGFSALLKNSRFGALLKIPLLLHLCKNELEQLHRASRKVCCSYCLWKSWQLKWKKDRFTLSAIQGIQEPRMSIVWKLLTKWADPIVPHSFPISNSPPPAPRFYHTTSHVS